MPVTFDFAIVSIPMLEFAPFAHPVPIPDPPLLPVVLLLPVTFAFSIVTIPIPEYPEPDVPIPADAAPPCARMEPFTIAKVPQNDPDGAPRPTLDAEIVARLPAPIEPSVTFDCSPQKMPPNCEAPSKRSVTTEPEIASENVDEETSRMRIVITAFVTTDPSDELPVTSRKPPGSRVESPLHVSVFPMIVNFPGPVRSQ
jgi:hypothetical protein